ncbi:MAG: type 4a pilus biogenesis protein PilO [Patescibacteria group bacterium]
MKKQAIKLYEKKQVPMLVGVMTVLAVALVMNYWIMPLWDTVRSGQLRYEAAGSELEAKQKELNAVERFMIFLNKETDKINLLNDVVPVEDSVDDIMIQVERMAVNNSLFVKSLSVVEPDKKDVVEIDNADEVKIMVQLEGEYPDLLNFIQEMQNSTRLVLVNKYSTASNIEATDQEVVHTLEMSVLYKK